MSVNVCISKRQDLPNESHQHKPSNRASVCTIGLSPLFLLPWLLKLAQGDWENPQNSTRGRRWETVLSDKLQCSQWSNVHHSIQLTPTLNWQLALKCHILTMHFPTMLFLFSKSNVKTMGRWRTNGFLSFSTAFNGDDKDAVAQHHSTCKAWERSK